jgi:hypothetical protein
MASPFFIKSKLGDLVIDIQGASTKPGTQLDGFTKKTKSPEWNNQLWEFVTSSFAAIRCFKTRPPSWSSTSRRQAPSPGHRSMPSL